MAWKLLFGSDIGLLSLFTIVFIIAMAFFMVRFYKKQADHDRQQQEK